MKHFIIFLVMFFCNVSVYAKNLNLYEQPQESAKVIAQIDPEMGIVPIFTPKDNTNWIKVGDPRNGNVGWIKSNDLKTAGSSFSYTQSVIHQNGQPQAYQILRVGNPKKLDAGQAEALMKKIEREQQALQKNMQNIMQDMFQNSGVIQPIIMPIIWYPQPPTAVPQKK